jgi:hypothetical protein
MPFRIRPMGQKVYDLLVPLHQYAKAIVHLDIPAALEQDVTQLSTWETHLTQQQDLDIPQFQKHLMTLRWRCGEVGVVWKEAWEPAMTYLKELTHDELQGLATQVTTLLQLLPGHTSSFDVWMYQDFRHALRPLLIHPYWSAVETLAMIQQTLIKTAKTRYKKRGKVLSGTQKYKQFLHTLQNIQKELRYE